LLVILYQKKKPQFPQSGKEFDSFSFLFKQMFNILSFTAVDWLQKGGISTKPKHFITLHLPEILVMQGINHSRLHVLNPSALQGMTITTECFFFSLPVWKNIFVNL